MVLPVPSRMVRSRREWFAPSRLGLGADRRREWFGAVVANGSDRREWFRPPSQMVRSRRREWFRPSRMVQTVVTNGSDRRPSSRIVQTVVANGSDRRPSSRMVRSRREWFRPSSRMVQTVVANGSEPSRMVQAVANSYRRL